MDFSALIEKMVIFVVLMVIGYVCARTGTTDKSFTRAASKLVINVFMSATIMNAVFVTELELSLAALSRILLLLFGVQLLICLLAFLFGRVIPVEKEHKAQLELLMGMSNTMFIALPVAESLFGPTAVFYCSLASIPFNVVLYTYGVLLLKSGREGEKLRVKDIFSVPLVVTVISVAVFLLDPPIPSVLRSLASAMSGATMPMSMLVIGTSLGTVSLLDAFKNPKIYLASFVRLILAPLAVWLLFRPLVDDPVLLMTMVLLGGAPSAVVITVLSIQYERDEVFSSEAVLNSTALSMVTIPALVWLLM